MFVWKKLVMFFNKLLKYSQKSCVFEQNRKKCCISSSSLQYWHVVPFTCYLIYILHIQWQTNINIQNVCILYTLTHTVYHMVSYMVSSENYVNFNFHFHLYYDCHLFIYIFCFTARMAYILLACLPQTFQHTSTHKVTSI